MSSKSASKTMKAIVKFHDCSVSYQLTNNVTGAALLDKACSRLLTYEQWWFGLLAVDNKGIEFWVHLDKKISQQNLRWDGDVVKMLFCVKFYPIDHKSEVIQDSTKKIFYSFLRDMVYREEIYCDSAACVSLAALHLQYSKGDLSGSSTCPTIVANEFGKLIPKGLVKRHDMAESEWHDVIIKMWKTYSIYLPHEAMSEGLKIIQNLDMYGVRYYDIKNKKRTPLLLGVEAGGMNIYKIDDRMIPKVSLAWNEIRSIAYIDRKFVIRVVEKNSPDFTMYSGHTKENNIIMHICVGNHELYMLRRKPQDPEEIRVLKEKARAAQQVVEEEYNKEIALKEKKLEYEQNVECFASAPAEERTKIMTEMDNSYNETLGEMNKRMEQLESEAEKARKAAGMSMSEVEKLRREKETYSNMAEEERLRNEKLAMAENESRIKASEAAEEAARVKAELEELKKRYEEDQKKMIAMQNAPPAPVTAAAVTPKVKKDYKTLRKETTKEVSTQVNMVNTMLATKVTEQTANDKLHTELVKSGVNKFKTLRAIRGGNTRARIDEFEAM